MSKVIYEPNKYLKMGIGIWPSMFEEIWSHRELMMRLFWRDLSAKYKQSILGLAWMVLMPMVAILTFMYLNVSGVMSIGKTDIAYPLFALMGLTVWQIFATGLQSGCQSLVSAGDMIGKINFPREVLVVSSLAHTLVDFIVKYFLIFLLMMLLQHPLNWTLLWFPIFVFPTVILTLGCSLLLSLLTGIVRDTANAVSLGCTFLMFLTPVFYPTPDEARFIFSLNPLSALVNAPREMVIYGRLQDMESFIWSSILSIIFFVMSWRIFHLVETKIPERI